ncbi:MAG TPA: 1-acyl-sn-glycerol-3-phosphate acyltransferase [Bacteroidia bacterium]|jgi:putative hemolysin|nr:1-acyl-sn-glycerol-3-phosphate acyltransferase [Bacteroidia bacterium]
MAIKRVDIDEMLRTKAPRPYKFIPRFFINYVKRVVHENDINDFLAKNGEKKGLDFINASIELLGADIQIKGLENIPKTGGYIFASNHPLGGLDGLAVIYSIAKVRTDIKFFVNELLLSLQQLDNILVPVNINGNSTRLMLEKVDEIYSSEMAIPIFPAGLVSRKFGKNEIKDLNWKKSFITKAKHYHKDIVPIYIEGRNSRFFYNFASFRKKIGIKINLEMFFLVDEMFGHKDKKVILHFGKPVSWKVFDKSHNDAEWANIFRDELYKKKGQIINETLLVPKNVT